MDRKKSILDKLPKNNGQTPPKTAAVTVEGRVPKALFIGSIAGGSVATATGSVETGIVVGGVTAVADYLIRPIVVRVKRNSQR